MKKHFYYLTAFFFISSYFTLPAQTDQVLVWGSYYGVQNGPFEHDVVESITETADGGFVIYGQSLSPSGLATPGAYQSINMGMADCFIAKFDEDRQRIWSTYFGGTGYESPNRTIRTLSDGSIVISGATTSSSNIATPGAFETVNPFLSGFLTRFSEEGWPMWSTYFGAGQSAEPGITQIYDLAVLPNDNIVTVGLTNASDLPVTGGAHQTDHAGNLDGFIATFDSSGELLWSTFFGGSEEDVIRSIQLDSNGNLIVLGTTTSESQIASEGAHQTINGGEKDLFLAKFSVDGTLIWSTYYGGENDESVYNICNLTIDNLDNIYVLSRTNSLTGIATDGAHQTEPDNSGEWEGNTFLARFSPDGTLEWGSYFGHSEIAGRSITMHSNNVVMVGATFSDSGVSSGNPWQANFPGTDELSVFISAFSSNGEPIWGTYYGGDGSDNPSNVVKFSNDLLAITGLTSSPNDITTSDGFQTQQFDIDGFFSFFEIDFSTSVVENELLPISIFPNPARESVRLNLPPHFAFQADIVVYNTVGQVVSQHTAFNSLQALPLNHPPGLYIVEARNGRQVARGKVILN